MTSFRFLLENRTICVALLHVIDHIIEFLVYVLIVAHHLSVSFI